MNDYDDFPSARQSGSALLRYGAMFIIVIFILGMLGWAIGLFGRVVRAPVETAVGVTERVLNPDHALQTYRWFHDSYQAVKAKKANIALAKSALDASSEDRKEARRVELLGIQQGCQQLIGEYNSRATRVDTVIFQHPERFLPGTWPGERSPLPTSLDMADCV